LCNNFQIGDASGVPECAGHGFGESGGDEAQVEEGEVKRRKYMGVWKRWLHATTVMMRAVPSKAAR